MISIAGNIAAERALTAIEQAFAGAAALQERLAAQARATDAARDSLAPLQDLAPSQQVRPAS